jgi:TonB family protein
MKKMAFIVLANLRICMVLVLMSAFSILFSINAVGQTADNSGMNPYVAVEEMPTFPGGNPALAKYIGEHLRYPSGPQEKGIQGKVIIKFCVTPQGGVSMLSVLKGVDPELDQEAMRVVKTITKFNPGKKGGVAVPVWFLIPITFTISNN